MIRTTPILYSGESVNVPETTVTSNLLSSVEAYNIIKQIYETQGWKINHTTTREERNLYIEAAVAALHYGHPIYNPTRFDRQWCIVSKLFDLFYYPLRSDYIIARVTTREYWEIAVNIGSENAYWSLGYGGVLGSDVNVYGPAEDSLRRILQ